MPLIGSIGEVDWRLAWFVIPVGMAGVALAAGIRPCAGALVVLVFSLSLGLFSAGIAATFAMAIGTALTTSAIAALAVLAKSLAVKLAGGRATGLAIGLAILEVLAAAGEPQSFGL